MCKSTLYKNQETAGIMWRDQTKDDTLKAEGRMADRKTENLSWTADRSHATNIGCGKAVNR